LEFNQKGVPSEAMLLVLLEFVDKPFRQMEATRTAAVFTKSNY
jgi:hypothetical protein